MSRYFEDLTVGEIHAAGEYTLTNTEIIEFAEQFDPQSFHTDEAAAKESMFEGLVASGLHTLCLATRLTIKGVLQDVAIRGGCGMDEIRWYEPVRPGDTLSVEAEVLDKSTDERHSDRGYVDFGRSAYTENGEVMSLVLHNIVRRKPTGDG